MPGYTISLLFWIIPIVMMSLFFFRRKILRPVQRISIIINCIILALIGFVLDLLFAKYFFRFPNPSAVLGISIVDIPIEEFIFYVTGFWFIILLYVFCDEYFLSRYNRDDTDYSRFSRRIRRRLYLNLTWKSALLLTASVAVFTILKQILNPAGSFIPGYIVFLTGVAYIPYFFFWRITRRFINFRALISTVLMTTLISIIWEVTLALPGGYWDYNHGAMVGIFIKPWNSLPVEAVTVWIFSSLIVFMYEYTKILLTREANPHKKDSGKTQ